MQNFIAKCERKNNKKQQQQQQQKKKKKKNNPEVGNRLLQLLRNEKPNRLKCAKTQIQGVLYLTLVGADPRILERMFVYKNV